MEDGKQLASGTEDELKRKAFREFWMGKMVLGFGDDLDQVRQVSLSLFFRFFSTSFLFVCLFVEKAIYMDAIGCGRKRV